MSDRSKFKRGSGCYKCGSCGKMTRETGDGESGCGLCAACYDYAGWENAHSDEGHEDPNGSPHPDCPICQGKPDPAEQLPAPKSGRTKLKNMSDWSIVANWMYENKVYEHCTNDVEQAMLRMGHFIVEVKS